MNWTDWKSAFDANDGNDFEILADHINLFGSVQFSVEYILKYVKPKFEFKSVPKANSH